MKRSFLLLLCAAFAYISTAQVSVGKPEDVKHFLTTKTIVFLHDNMTSEYNGYIKTAVEKYWKITPYEFKTYSKDVFDELRKDTSLSFLKLNTMLYPNDDVKAPYYFLSVVLGGKYKLVPDMPDIASIPLSYVEGEEPSYAYKTAMLVKFLHAHLNLIKDQPKLKQSKIMKIYKKKLPEIKTKTLYLIADELGKDIDTQEKIAQVYKNSFKIVSREEALAAIEKEDNSVVFMHKIGPAGSKKKARCYKIALNAADGSLYNLSWHMISTDKPDGITAKDLKALGK